MIDRNGKQTHGKAKNFQSPVRSFIYIILEWKIFFQFKFLISPCVFDLSVTKAFDWNFLSLYSAQRGSIVSSKFLFQTQKKEKI